MAAAVPMVGVGSMLLPLDEEAGRRVIVRQFLDNFWVVAVREKPLAHPSLYRVVGVLESQGLAFVVEDWLLAELASH